MKKLKKRKTSIKKTNKIDGERTVRLRKMYEIYPSRAFLAEQEDKLINKIKAQRKK